MPPLVDSLEKLLLLIAGGIVYWLGGVLKKWTSEKTSTRREIVDKLAKAEADNRALRESLYDHRNAMLQSGDWTRETLPQWHENPTK